MGTVRVDEKTRPNYMSSKNIHFTYKDTYRLKVKGRRKIQHANTDQNKAGVAILFSDRADFREGKLSGTKRGII